MLSEWIKLHLDLKDISGLKFVEQTVKGLIFGISWARLGDDDWIKQWDVFIVSLILFINLSSNFFFVKFMSQSYVLIYNDFLVAFLGASL